MREDTARLVYTKGFAGSLVPSKGLAYSELIDVTLCKFLKVANHRDIWQQSRCGFGSSIHLDILNESRNP